MNNDRFALNELYRASLPDRPHNLLHYLYFPTKQAATDAGRILTGEGFKTKNRRAADGIDWLLLVRHNVVPTEETILAVRQMMEELAAEGEGEYDGWEIEVH